MPTGYVSFRDRGVAALASVVRLGFAAWFVARPDAVATTLGVTPSPTRRALTRVLTLRELLLGAGCLSAVARRRPPAPWLAAMAVADVVNGSLTLVATVRDVVPRRRGFGLAVFDLSGTAWELALARRMHQRRP